MRMEQMEEEMKEMEELMEEEMLTSTLNSLS